MNCRSVGLTGKHRPGSGVWSGVSESEPGWVQALYKLEDNMVNNITVDRSICKISINGIKLGCVPMIIRSLAANEIMYINIADSAGGEADTFSFSLPEEDYERVSEILDAFKSESGGGEILAEKNLAVLSVIGSGVAYDSKITAMYYDTMLKENVKIYLLSLSEKRISALVEGNAVDRAITGLRARFEEAGLYSPRKGL